jgi:segregation and condensation protein B
MSDQEKPDFETAAILEPDTAEVAALDAAKEKSEGEHAPAEEQVDEEEADDEEADEGDADDDGDDEDDDDDDDDDDVDGEEEAGEQTADEQPAIAEPVAAVAAAVATAAEGTVTDVVSPDHAQHLRLLEALVFAGTQALDEKELADRLPNDADVKRLIADLTEMYAGRGVNLVQVAGGWAFRTASDLSEKLKIERPVTRKLSRAAVETLAIIAYHQPVTRAEIEQVRGVGLSKGTLDLLFEQNWIKPMGRRRAPGKPVTWGTSEFFLEHFGLPSLDDLPGQEELKAAGLLDPRSQPPIFRPEEPDLPLEPGEDEADEPLAVDEKGR